MLIALLGVWILCCFAAWRLAKANGPSCTEGSICQPKTAFGDSCERCGQALPVLD
jgi:hypothetical protein